MLLTVSDLPSGWSTASAGSSSTPPPSCLAPYESLRRHLTEVGAEFVQGQGLSGFPAFLEKLLSAGSKAKSDYQVTTRALAHCSQLTLTDQGKKFTGNIEPLSLAPVGAQSRAYAMTFLIEGVHLDVEVAVFRQGRVVGLILYADTGSPDTTVVTQLARLAAAKVAVGPSR